jgi:hypothetical protein
VAGDTLCLQESQACLPAMIRNGSGVYALRAEEPDSTQMRGLLDFRVGFDIGGRMVHPHFIRSLRAFIRR